MTGVIRTLHESFGFINGDDGVDYFFLPSALQQASVPFTDLTEGLLVASFIPIRHPKGPRAIEILIRKSEGTYGRDQKERRHPRRWEQADSPLGWKRD